MKLLRNLLALLIVTCAAASAGPINILSGARCFNCASDPGGGDVPAWASAQSDTTFTKPFTTFTTLASVAPAGFPEGTAGSHVKWSSGRFGVYNDHPGYFHIGGGHSDGADGNLYFADMVDIRWYRLTDIPAAYSGGTATAWGDGTPRVPHTYGHIVWTPGFVWMIGQAGPYPSGDTHYTAWRLNLSSLAWAQTETAWPNRNFAGAEAASYYSPTRAAIYTISQAGEVWSTDVSSGAMSKVGNPDPVSGNGTSNGSAFCDALGALFYRSNSSGVISIFDVDAGSPSWQTITVSGTFGVSNYPGMLWHPASQKILAWGHSTSRGNVFTLAPPVATPATFADLLGTWTAGSTAFGGVTPDAPDATGTHKRFDMTVDPFGDGHDWLVLFSSVDESPNFGKLPVGGL